MPVINVKMYSGRTQEQKREFAKRITEVTTDVLKIPAEAVTIILDEYDKSNWASGGKLHSEQK